MKTIIQWNVNGYYAHYEQLQIIIKQHNPDMLCLQETNFKKNHNPSMKNYSLLVKNRVNTNFASGGVAIAISNKYSATEIPLKTNLEAIAATVHFPNKINVCNVYLPNSQPLHLQDVQDLLEQIPPPVILTGDFNSHNPMWGSSRIDARGKIIEKILQDPNLILLNTGHPTHFNASNGSLSAIDLTICDPRVAQRIEWSVIDDLHDSNHFPIKVTYEDNSSHCQFLQTPR
ncbi:Probable RNA-directed DNA polymerase from transposon X-element [Anthophora quadrimaculata]